YLCGAGLVVIAIFKLANLAQSRRAHGTGLAVICMIFFAGVTLLNFDQLLTAIDNTLGTGSSASFTSDLTSYNSRHAPVSSVGGDTPTQTFQNVVNAFSYYFQCFGALMVFLGIIGLKAASEGRYRHHGIGGPL